MSERIAKLFNRYIAAISAENVTADKPALTVQNEHARESLDVARRELREAISGMGASVSEAYDIVIEVGTAWMRYIDGDIRYQDMQAAHTKFIEQLAGLQK